MNQHISIESFLELIPDYVIEIAEELQKHNYKAYLVGGSIRDILLGIKPNDYDIATDAYPEAITEIFPKSIPTGAKFGTITVVTEDKLGERFDIEVTTFRSDADYVGGRWPSKVEFTKTIEEDLARRDYTVNAVALDLQNFDEPGKTVADLLVDPYGGLADLDAKIIKAVRDPLERFSEDGLRPVRGCRLAAQLDFDIDPATFKAMQETNHVTKRVSVERFREELVKLILGAPVPSKGMYLLKDAGILELFIPELLEGIDVVQPEFHTDDVFTHSLKALDAAEDSVKLAALFHDIGKPRTRSEDENGIHFYGHDQLGAEMTEQILKRLRFSNDEIARTALLVRWHMFYYPSADWRKENNVEDVHDKVDGHGWSDGAVRRFIKNVGGPENIDDLMKLRIADASANPKSDFNPIELEALSKRIAEVREQEMALKVTDLDITGHDLMTELGIEKGPKLGYILNELLEKVIDDPLLNRRDLLLGLAKDELELETRKPKP